MSSTNSLRHRSLSILRRRQRRAQLHASSDNNRNHELVQPGQRTAHPQAIVDNASAYQPPVTRCIRAEMEAEDELFGQIEELFERFLSRPGRQLPYNNIVRWTNNFGTPSEYSVVIKIDQPAPHS
jgi:hypothetical protein